MTAFRLIVEKDKQIPHRPLFPIRSLNLEGTVGKYTTIVCSILIFTTTILVGKGSTVPCLHNKVKRTNLGVMIDVSCW